MARLRVHPNRLPSPGKRSCDSMMCSSSCARSNPARPLLGLLVWSLSIRRSAAATRFRARSRSATVYCRGPGRVRFPRDPFDALLARMAAVSFFAAAVWPLRFSKRTASIAPSRRRALSSRARRGVHGWLPLLVIFDDHHLGTSMPSGGHPHHQLGLLRPRSIRWRAGPLRP